MSARASEICGNGADDNADGQADEGCWPAGVTGVCESPLSCSRGGAIAPKTGNLVYRLPPDLSPKVPHGIGIPFQRVYMSQYSPGSGLPSATDFKSPLGYGFQHNWMSWIEMTGDYTDPVILHTTTGQEVRLDYSHTNGFCCPLSSGTHFYTAQPGYHFKSISVSFSGCPECVFADWNVTTLSGTTYRYSGGQTTWKLSEIRSPGAAANVDLTYSGDGQVDKVEHETGNKYLTLEYYGSSPKLLRYVKYYTAGSPDVLRSTVEYIYSSGKLTTVKIGDVGGTMTTVQSYSYDADGYLSLVEDGGGLDIAGFAYVDGDDGKVARLETGAGDIGYEYSPDPMDCLGTQVFYHRDSATSCDTDADCGTGNYCGGQTDPLSADTGTCYKVRRCVEVSSPNEDLITGVSAECEGGACPSAVDVKQYDWETGAGDDIIELAGTRSADNVWTSYEYNSDGMVTKMVEGDTDSDASTEPTGARVTYYFYDDTDYPGLVTEVRRLSELKPGGNCDATTSTDCKRTSYIYNDDGQVTQIGGGGYTYDASGAVVHKNTGSSSFTRNAFGQITEARGPHASLEAGDDITETSYHGAGDPLLEGYPSSVVRNTSATSTLTTNLPAYDHWGMPIEVERPDGNVSCFEYDEYRGFRTGVRASMNGQSDCSSPHSSDLEIQYTHDTWGRLTKVEKPAGNCTFWEYDGEGRLEKIKDRDDCNAGSSGDTIEHTYSIDGLLEKTEYKDASGQVTYRQESEYRADRRLARLINPVSPSHGRDFDYHDDGMLAEIVFEDGLGKQELDYDNLNRREELRRYTDSMSFDTWDLTPTKQLDLLAEVEDDDGKALSWVHDDFGRRVKQVSPDSGTTIWVYDRASSITTMIEAVGATEELEHTYSYDDLYRLTAHHVADSFACDDSGQSPQVQTAYDNLPAGISCPTGAGCANLDGRVAYVKTWLLFCDEEDDDDTVDQETFFSYDDAGRLVSTYLRDDIGRTAKTSYAWDENSNLVELTRPSGSVMAWVYGSTGSNSDRDKAVELQRKVGTSYETVIGSIEYLPFGPVSFYRQENELQNKRIEANLSRNLAHRPTEFVWEKETSGSDVFKIAYTEDEKGRITARDFTGGHTDLQDAWYTYDDMDRVLCDAAASGSCPTSGSNLKTTLSGSPPYSASGERTSLAHQSLDYGATSHSYSYVTGSDKLAAVGDVTYTFDDRGNRIEEDDSGLANAFRNFFYDHRGNLFSAQGKYKRDAMASWYSYSLIRMHDERNHRVFQFLWDDENFGTGEVPQWFHYFDAFDRLIEVKHLPDATDANTYSIYQFFWLGNRPIYYVQIDFPGQTTTRRYLHADELDRPLEAYSHPSSGNTERVWAINPDLFGWDDVIEGAAVYQPLRFPGQLVEPQTTAWVDFGDPPPPPPKPKQKPRLQDVKPL
jgi:YD repeat-containing protein